MQVLKPCSGWGRTAITASQNAVADGPSFAVSASIRVGVHSAWRLRAEGM